MARPCARGPEREVVRVCAVGVCLMDPHISSRVHLGGAIVVKTTKGGSKGWEKLFVFLITFGYILRFSSYDL